MDSEGSAFIAGEISGSGSVDFDPGVGTAVAMLGTGAKDAFLAKYSSTGALEWVWVNTNGNSDNDVASGVAVGPDDSVYVVGQFEGTLDFDKNAGTTDLVVTGSPALTTTISLPAMTPTVTCSGHAPRKPRHGRKRPSALP